MIKLRVHKILCSRSADLYVLILSVLLLTVLTLKNTSQWHAAIMAALNLFLSVVTFFALRVVFFSEKFNHFYAFLIFFLLLAESHLVSNGDGHAAYMLSLFSSSILLFVFNDCLRRVNFVKTTLHNYFSQKKLRVDELESRRIKIWLLERLVFFVSIFTLLGYFVLSTVSTPLMYVLSVVGLLPACGVLLVTWVKQKELLKLEIPRKATTKNVIFFFPWREGYSHTVNRWVKVFEQGSQNTTILLFQARKLNGLSTKLPVINCSDIDSAARVISSKVKRIFYVSDSTYNHSFMWRVRNSISEDIEHIFLNHGYSEKVCNGKKSILNYDVVASPTDLYAENLRRKLSAKIPKCENFGRPDLEFFRDKSYIQQGYIAYTPTWEGMSDKENYSSILTLSEKIIVAVLRKTDKKIVFRPHPHTGDRCKDYTIAINNIVSKYRCNPNFHFDPFVESEIIVANCNALISDVSAVIIDAIYFKKPVYLVSQEENLYEGYPVRRVEGENGINKMIEDISSEVEDAHSEACIKEMKELDFLRFAEIVD